jgi:hypothetical protein
MVLESLIEATLKKVVEERDSCASMRIEKAF